MKNFGFADLAVVAPHPPVWSEVVSAVNATDVLANTRVCETLDEAIADRNLVVGTTDRMRVEERQAIYTPYDLSRELSQADYRLALVFGPEKHGLVNQDLSRCHRIMSIPTQRNCPSMNLGQAVAVACYELIRQPAQEAIIPRPAESATAGAVEAALSLALDLLHRIDFVLPGNEPDLKRRIRSSFLRFNLTRSDVEMLCGILNQIKKKMGEKRDGAAGRRGD